MSHSQNNTHRVRSSEHILSCCAEKRLLRTYAHFLKFKSVYTDSRLHRGNKAKLARETGVSESTVRIQLGKMRRMGWIRVENSDYIFITKNQLYINLGLPRAKMTFKCCLFIDANDSIGDIIKKLASKLIETNLKRQDFLKGVKKRYLSNRLVRLDRKYKKYFRSRTAMDTSGAGNTVISCKTTLSCGKMGELLGVSKSRACQIKRSLINAGMLSAEPNFVVLRPNICFSRIDELLGKIQLALPRLGVFKRGNDILYRSADIIRILPPSPISVLISS